MLWYTVYRLEEVLAIGSAADCAKALEISLPSFQTYLSRAKAGKQTPYTFVVENTATGKFTTYHANPITTTPDTPKEELP